MAFNKLNSIRYFKILIDADQVIVYVGSIVPIKQENGCYCHHIRVPMMSEDHLRQRIIFHLVKYRFKHLK